jgi:thiol-disulfide isomerase/thioredoxin
MKLLNFVFILLLITPSCNLFAGSGEKNVKIVLPAGSPTGISRVKIDKYSDGKYLTLGSAMVVGKYALLTLDKSMFPGDFQLVFSNKQNQTIATKFLLGSAPDSITPVFSQRQSSAIVYGDNMNKDFQTFQSEMVQKSQKIDLLTGILNTFDRKGAYHKYTEKEYGIQLKKYNKWLEGFSTGHDFTDRLKPLFYQGSKNWEERGSAKGIFSSFPVNDTILLDYNGYKEFLDFEMRKAFTHANSDSALIAQSVFLANRAAKGTPKVYGWLIDYLFVGFETYGIDKGIAMLKPHTDNPDCLTKRRDAVNKRVEGMESLKEGTIMPPHSLPDVNGNMVNIYNPKSDKPYRLLMFWANDCEHCMEMVPELLKWWEKPENKAWVELVTLDLSDKNSEWKRTVSSFPKGTINLYAKGGINAPVSNDFYLLSTPAMFVTGPDGKIELLPKNIRELKKFIGN